MTETMGHCTPKLLEAYYAGALGEADLARLMAHLAECPQCLARAERIGDGLVFMDKVAMETRREAARAARLEEALSRAEAGVGPVLQRERIRRWRHRVAESGITSRRNPGQWRYALAGTPRLRLRTRSRSPGPDPLQWVAGEPSRIAVSEVQPVWIGLDHAQPGGLVALVPESGSGPTRLAEIKESRGPVPRWMAQFDSVEPGEYFVVFEQ